MVTKYNYRYKEIQILSIKSEDGTGGRRPLLGDVDCHPPILFEIKGVVLATPFYVRLIKFYFTKHKKGTKIFR